MTTILILIFTLTSIIQSCVQGPRDINENYFLTDVFVSKYKGIDLFDHPNPSITKVYLLNERIGFLLASDADAQFIENSSKSNSIYVADMEPVVENAIFFRSIDGGKTLEKQILGHGHLLRDVFVSADKKCIFLIRENEFKKNYTMLKSTDMGATWIEIDFFKDKWLTRLYFIDTSTGIARVYNKTIGRYIFYQTNDGGRTWNAINLETTTFILSPRGKLSWMNDSIFTIYEYDINTKEITEQKFEIPLNNKITRIFYDELTKKQYFRLKDTINNKSYIYSLESKSSIELPANNIEQMNVYGNYIAITNTDEDGVGKYYYSTDLGKTWHKETPKEYFYYGHQQTSLYGEGYMWAIVRMYSAIRPEYDGRNEPLMVRIPDDVSK